MSEWQPIATAPKDGTRMLVACTNGAVYAVRWGPLPDDGWVVVGGSDLSVGRVRRIPTHWMPLPQPPSSELR